MYKFFAFLGRMKLINRWSLMFSMRQENIMEHSQQVAVIAHALALIGNTYYNANYDANKTAVIALFHEASEVITGDLPTPIKYFNPEIKTAYKSLEKIANDKLLCMLPQELQSSYVEIIEPDNNCCEVKLVKHADKICGYIKCIEEIKMSNNEFKKAKVSIENDIKAFNSEEVNYFMRHFIKPFELTLDELD